MIERIRSDKSTIEESINIIANKLNEVRDYINLGEQVLKEFKANPIKYIADKNK